MTEKLKRIRVNHSDLLLPLILSFVLSSAVFSIYSVPFFSVWTAASALICIISFIFCGFVNKHRVIGGILITFISIAILVIFFNLIMGADYGQSFRQWFLTGADNIKTKNVYLLAVLIGFPFLFSFTIYYFSVILYRTSFLMLVSLIPCVIYVKVLSDISNNYVAVISMLNVALLMINVRKKRNSDSRVIGKRASYLSASVFIFLLLISSSLIPKQEEARYYDRFEDLFMDANINLNLSENYSMLSEYSGNADNFRNFLNRKMYSIYSNDITYLKRQTFDYYDFENDRWYPDSEFSEPFVPVNEWRTRQQAMNLSKLQKAISEAAVKDKDFVSEYGLSDIASADNISEKIITLNVQPENFGAVYYLSPVRVINVSPQYGAESMLVTKSGVFMSTNGPHSNYMTYQVSYYDEYESRFEWFENGGSDLNDSDAYNMLYDLYNILGEESEYSDTVSAYMNSQLDADEYAFRCSENNGSISDEIKELAEEVTADCEYDWEKAEALQSYFLHNDYIYDIEYISEDTSPEYFLFESRRGSCSDYASAFVLMARSVGLTARYAEGYAPDTTSYDGVYTIEDSNSHAYPEVYIENMGWIVYEPTVPSSYAYRRSSTNQGNNFNMPQIEIDYGLTRTIVVFSVLIFIVVCIFIAAAPFAEEGIFRIRLGFSENGRAIMLIYKRISAKKAKKAVKNASCLTPWEFTEKYYEVSGNDISELTYILESMVYGEEVPDKEDKQSAKKIYKKCGRKLRK